MEQGVQPIGFFDSKPMKNEQMLETVFLRFFCVEIFSEDFNIKKILWSRSFLSIEEEIKFSSGVPFATYIIGMC